MNLEELMHRDPIADRGISVVILFHNEAECMETVISGVTGVFDRMQRGHEVIIVNDGLTDAKREVAEHLAISNKRIHVIQHDSRLGYGAALRTGFHAAKYPLVLQLDCNHHYDASEIERFLAAIDHVDIVCGYRERHAVTFGQRLGSWLYRWLVRWIFGVHVRDVDCGFRLYRRSALRRIPIQSNGRFSQAEILAKATFMNMLITEVPVSHLPNTAGIGERPREHSDHVFRDAAGVFRRPQFCTVSSRPDDPRSNSRAA